MTEKISKNQALAESALMVALSIAIFAISDFMPWPYAYGGGFSLFGQVPVILVSYRHGIKKGLAASTVLALFEMMMGYKNFTYVAGLAAYLVVALADYLIAFGMAVAVYSLVYNGSFMAIELVLTVIGLIACGKIFKLDKKRVI